MYIHHTHFNHTQVLSILAVPGPGRVGCSSGSPRASREDGGSSVRCSGQRASLAMHRRQVLQGRMGRKEAAQAVDCGIVWDKVKDVPGSLDWRG